MKKRYGFVSNSSSSSFVIRLEDISEKQLEKIVNHHNSSGWKKQNEEWIKEYEHLLLSERDVWTIKIGAKKVLGYVNVNNFDMERYLGEIGIDKDMVEWDEGYRYIFMDDILGWEKTT